MEEGTERYRKTSRKNHLIIFIMNGNVAYIIFAIGVVTANAALFSTPDIVHLTSSNFHDHVLLSESVWIVGFYAPWCGHCQRLVPEYLKAAKALRGVIKVGAVNCDENKPLADMYKVTGFPSIKIFGILKNEPETFNGPRTAQGVIEAGLAALKTKVYAEIGVQETKRSNTSKGNPKDVINLTDSNFDSLVMDSEEIWLVEFYAPWCGHCKSLVPHWEQAATALKGKVKFGALDVTKNSQKANEYLIHGYPTIKLFTSGIKDTGSILDYNGERTAESIITWALEAWTENMPPPKIEQLVNTTSLLVACQDHPLCVVSFLPNILDCNAECRNAYIKILSKLGIKYKNKSWGWIWTEAGAQQELEKTLEIGGFGYPALVVINNKKMIYSSQRGSFSYEGIYEFLRDLAFGRGTTTSPIKGGTLPSISSVDAWDGQDGQLPPEFDDDVSEVKLEDIKDEL